jgi:beta-lactamase regulating signal transducer with metallopeptidase domain
MIHFFWIGALLGVAGMVLRRLLHSRLARGVSAESRYAIALGVLACLVASPVVIGLYVYPMTYDWESSAGAVPVQFDASNWTIELNQPPALPAAESDVAFQPAAGGDELSWAERIAAWDWRTAASTAPHVLPWLWLLGAPLTFAYLATGLLGAERLRQTARLLADDDSMTQVCRELAERLRIGPVALGISHRVRGPVLMGVARPLILLPASALTGWTAEQLEMVLMHELAHVRRWDNLVNLLQRVVESLFFFHPAVWIVSHWVRREREHCCDELVVRQTGQPQMYVETLAALALNELTRGRLSASLQHPAQVASAMARRDVLQRIRYILHKEDASMRLSRKTLGMMLSALVAAALLIGWQVSGRTLADDRGGPSDDKKSPPLVDGGVGGADAGGPAGVSDDGGLGGYGGAALGGNDGFESGAADYGVGAGFGGESRLGGAQLGGGGARRFGYGANSYGASGEADGEGDMGSGYGEGRGRPYDNVVLIAVINRKEGRAAWFGWPGQSKFEATAPSHVVLHNVPFELVRVNAGNIVFRHSERFYRAQVGQRLSQASLIDMQRSLNEVVDLKTATLLAVVHLQSGRKAMIGSNAMQATIAEGDVVAHGATPITVLKILDDHILLRQADSVRNVNLGKRLFPDLNAGVAGSAGWARPADSAATCLSSARMTPSRAGRSVAQAGRSVAPRGEAVSAELWAADREPPDRALAAPSRRAEAGRVSAAEVAVEYPVRADRWVERRRPLSVRNCGTTASRFRIGETTGGPN